MVIIFAAGKPPRTNACEEEADAGFRGEEADAGLRGEEADAGLRGEEADAGSRGEEADAGSRGEEADAGSRGEEADAGSRGEESDAGGAGTTGTDAADKPPQTAPKQGKVLMTGQQTVRVVLSVRTKRRSGLMRWMAACSSFSICWLMMTLFKLRVNVIS